jgi:hypothetical protein
MSVVNRPAPLPPRPRSWILGRHFGRCPNADAKFILPAVVQHYPCPGSPRQRMATLHGRHLYPGSGQGYRGSCKSDPEVLAHVSFRLWAYGCPHRQMLLE